MSKPRLRCAVYTRKSSEEGLDQDFNSLHAQREACEAFIKSQVGEGWSVIETQYDDGGFSGGTMERPALQRLLSDIEAGRVDIVVVYKVDRLTRALSDFAKMVEIFDARGVSFVSVTQQFNTTTSMGRLTLNVLLSFAQFEREVTGERIRDKIAASKKKGMWMGGHVPLGYEARDRSLVINPVEAKTIRSIFRLYLEHGCVDKLKAAADAQGLRSRVRTRLDGATTGGGSFSRGHLYAILQNPIYIGQIAHKGRTYPGAHEAIIDAETWEAVQIQLAANRKARRNGTNAKEPSLLAGILFDADGQPLTPSHAVKNGKRYRYYVSRHLIAGEHSKGRGWRIPAGQIETVVRDELCGMFSTKARLLDALGEGMDDAHSVASALEEGRRLGANLRAASPSEGKEMLADLLSRIVIEVDCIKLVISCTGLRPMLGCSGEHRKSYEIKVPVELKRHGRELKLIVEGQDNGRPPDAALIKSIVRAHKWFGQLKTGEVKGTAEIAASEGLTQSYVTRVLRLAFLAPDVVEAILAGRQPVNLSADKLVKSSANLPTDWEEQRAALGF